MYNPGFLEEVVLQTSGCMITGELNEGSVVMGRKSNVSEAQRREVVLSLLRREESAAKLARRLGVSEPTLYAWRDKFIAGGMAALASGRNGASAESRRIKELERAVQERDQVVGELTIVNRILEEVSDGSR